MGDNGKLYIPEDEVPEYKGLLREADLILPNQFEAECVSDAVSFGWATTDFTSRLLSDTPITDLDSLAAAIQVLHKTYLVPHVIITSLRLTRDNHTIPSRAPSKPASATASGQQTPLLNPETSHPAASATQQIPTESLSPDTSHPAGWTASLPSRPLAPPSPNEDEEVEHITIIGSTTTSDHKPRLFRIDTPLLPFFFSGTGDMFAALTVPRLIEAVQNSSPDLSSKPSWKSPDDVPADELPLAKACQKVLASMQSILGKTSEGCKEKMKAYDARHSLR